MKRQSNVLQIAYLVTSLLLGKEVKCSLGNLAQYSKVGGLEKEKYNNIDSAKVYNTTVYTRV